MSKWISVEDKLPEEEGGYLVYWLSEGFSHAWHRVSVCYFVEDRFASGSLKQPTHWMPLPEPPKEGNNHE